MHPDTLHPDTWCPAHAGIYLLLNLKSFKPNPLPENVRGNPGTMLLSLSEVSCSQTPCTNSIHIVDGLVVAWGYRAHSKANRFHTG